jgi:hypothetical protein
MSVGLGIELETGAGKLITVNLYTSAVPFPLLYPNALTLIGTTTHTIVSSRSGAIQNIPITATVPAGSQLVVEINVPADTSGHGHLVIGSNSAPENAPSYLSTNTPITPGVLDTPTTTAALMYANMHIVMNVDGCGLPPIPSGGSTVASPWTAAGSTGAIDEDSSSIAQVTNFTLGLLPGATSTVTARYNITGVGGLSRFCPATQSNVSIRFRDSDGSGQSAQVALEIHRSNLAIGGNEIIYAFDSNGSAQPVGASFQTFSTLPAIDFDFDTYIYWIEANLGSIKISETAGAPCR